MRAADIYREGRELAKISDQLAVEIPLVEDAMSAIGRLRADGVRVIATLVFGAAQALLAAKAGAYAVSVALLSDRLTGSTAKATGNDAHPPARKKNPGARQSTRERAARQ